MGCSGGTSWQALPHNEAMGEPREAKRSGVAPPPTAAGARARHGSCGRRDAVVDRALASVTAVPSSGTFDQAAGRAFPHRRSTPCSAPLSGKSWTNPRRKKCVRGGGARGGRPAPGRIGSAGRCGSERDR
jgi:hypothetical protein